jgi:hypothetical protein
MSKPENMSIEEGKKIQTKEVQNIFNKIIGEIF